MSNFIVSGKKVWITGHRGMVGSALVRRFQQENCTILTASRDELDLRNPILVRQWIKEHKPDAVIIAAAKVGGILANDTYPADFIHDNIAISSSIINGSFHEGVNRLMFLGSSCIYPKFAAQPIAESALLTGPLEPTNEWYALAKIAGIKMCQAYRKQHGVDYISAMPTNLYGPGDNYNLHTSHVIPALIRKFHEAKTQSMNEVIVWGSGKPLREFMHVDDLADALFYLMANYSEYEHINVGSGQEISIYDLAVLISDIVGFKGKLTFDQSKPDGTPRKLMDSSRLSNLGWEGKIKIRDGIKNAYEDFVLNH